MRMIANSFRSLGLFLHIETFAPMAVWKSLALSRLFVACPQVAGSQRSTGHHVQHDQVPCCSAASLDVLLEALTSSPDDHILGVCFAIHVLVGFAMMLGDVLVPFDCNLLANHGLANLLLSGILFAIRWGLVAIAAAHLHAIVLLEVPLVAIVAVHLVSTDHSCVLVLVDILSTHSFALVLVGPAMGLEDHEVVAAIQLGVLQVHSAIHLATHSHRTHGHWEDQWLNPSLLSTGSMGRWVKS